MPQEITHLQSQELISLDQLKDSMEGHSNEAISEHHNHAFGPDTAKAIDV